MPENIPNLRASGANDGVDLPKEDAEPFDYGQYYGVTLKPTYNSYKKMVQKDENILCQFLHELSEAYTFRVVDFQLENDSRGYLHLHATVIRTHINALYIKPIKGWHIYVYPIYRYSAWADYIIKDVVKKIESEYSFIEDQ